MESSDLVAVTSFNSQTELLKFLNELAQTHNLNQTIISIVKGIHDRYEVFYYKD